MDKALLERLAGQTGFDGMGGICVPEEWLTHFAALVAEECIRIFKEGIDFDDSYSIDEVESAIRAKFCA